MGFSVNRYLKQQCSQHHAGRAALIFFDLGPGVCPESVVVVAETALELCWAELAGLGPAGARNKEMIFKLQNDLLSTITSET